MYVICFAMVIMFYSVFEKDPNGADSTASSSHRTRNLLEFSASQESSTAQKIPGDNILQKSDRWDENLWHPLSGRGQWCF